MGKVEDRVRERIKEQYGNVAEFSRQTGIPYSTLNNVLTRGIAGSGFETVSPMLKALGLDANALLDKRVIPISHESDFIDVPLYGKIAAGTPIEKQQIDDYFPIPMPLFERYSNCFLLEVDGESMNKKLPNGCYALVDPDQIDPIEYKPYALCVNGHDATIKRVHKLNNGYELLPDSNDPTFEPVTYNYNEPDTDEITIIGRVVWFTMPFDWEY